MENERIDDACDSEHPANNGAELGDEMGEGHARLLDHNLHGGEVVGESRHRHRGLLDVFVAGAGVEEYSSSRCNKMGMGNKKNEKVQKPCGVGERVR